MKITSTPASSAASTARRRSDVIGMLRLQLNPHPNRTVGVRELGHQTPPSKRWRFGTNPPGSASFEFVSAIVAHPASGENVGVGVSDDWRGTHPPHA